MVRSCSDLFLVRLGLSCHWASLDRKVFQGLHSVCHTETPAVDRHNPLPDPFDIVRLLLKPGAHSLENHASSPEERFGLLGDGLFSDLLVDDRHRILGDDYGLGYLVYDNYL